MQFEKNILFDFFYRINILDNEINNEKKSIVEKIINNQIEKININNFVNVNNDK